jgi:predicted aspartyl protease
MVRGFFDGNTPFVSVIVAWKNDLQSHFVVLDTGFTGEIQLASQEAEDLGLQVVSVTRTMLASGEIREMQTAFVLASMEGERKEMSVLISEGESLVGIGFLEKFGYTAILNCKRKTIVLEKDSA